MTPTNQIVKSVEAAKSTIEAVTESAPKGALKSVAPIASKPPMPLRTDKTMRPPVAHTPLSIEPLPKFGLWQFVAVSTERLLWQRLRSIRYPRL